MHMRVAENYEHPFWDTNEKESVLARTAARHHALPYRFGALLLAAVRIQETAEKEVLHDATNRNFFNSEELREVGSAGLPP